MDDIQHIKDKIASLEKKLSPSEFRVEHMAHKILCHQLLMFHNSHMYEQETREVIALMEQLGFMGWPFDPDISQLETLLSHYDSKNQAEKDKA
jgi:hypothetical protein